MQKCGIIALIGRPNSGKSTLLNTLLDSPLSIVSPKAQTTRDRIQGIVTRSQGQAIFIDTPGIHRARTGGINEYMVQEAIQSLDSPDLVLYLTTPGSRLEHEQPVIAALTSKLARMQTPVLLISNKADLSATFSDEDAIRAELVRQGIRVAGHHRISATQSTGLASLWESIWALLPEGPILYPDAEQISDRSLRYLSAEAIREQLFEQLSDELPYGCAVMIEQFEETQTQAKKDIVKIMASIHVERDSQKGIVVGKGASKIKEIGTQARKRIEKLVGMQVHLALKVAVAKNWTQDAHQLKRMGYELATH